MKVFLGGTCNNSTWREELIPMLTINYFNPVVDDWTEEDQQIEENEKRVCDIHLYVITKEILGCYSIAEVVEDSFNKGIYTIFFIVQEGLSDAQIKSLKAVEKIVLKHGGYIKNDNDTLQDLADLINSLKPIK